MWSAVDCVFISPAFVVSLFCICISRLYFSYVYFHLYFVFSLFHICISLLYFVNLLVFVFVNCISCCQRRFELKWYLHYYYFCICISDLYFVNLLVFVFPCICCQEGARRREVWAEMARATWPDQHPQSLKRRWWWRWWRWWWWLKKTSLWLNHPSDYQWAGF